MEADGIVIGAGVVGLAAAAALARRHRSVLVLERRGGVGQEISSRNSEVIHAGLYYPTGSLKAQTCVEGRERLYPRCLEHRIPHRRTGKLVVATSPEELEGLAALAERALANGAGAVELLSGEEVARREPRVRALGALWSPESGIIDAHALVTSYQAEAEAHGTQIVLRTTALGLERESDAWVVQTVSAQGERFSVRSPTVINAAGLSAGRVAQSAGLDIDRLSWRIHPCKGDYFAAAPSLGCLTTRPVYPVPAAAGLGIHVTPDLGGRYRLGPDAEYVEQPRYEVDPLKAGPFAQAVARYLPEIRPEHLTPDFAGVRPKLQGPGDGFRDFVIEEGSSQGAPGLVNLIGIESPGLTAAGAIAERVADWVTSGSAL
jgi:L-2-hydroxyglutarate oxidase LhgO